jgi:hypothetical protein
MIGPRKMNAVLPYFYLCDLFTKLVNRLLAHDITSIAAQKSA